MPKITQNRWVYKPEAKIELVSELQNELKCSQTIARLLVQRGVNSFEAAKTFFRPSLTDFHDPFLMKDMEKAICRIQDALDSSENILIYGDYDVDGTSAVALVYTYFSKFTDNISYYIPDRYKEGYGISFQGIDFADDNDFSLIIALDCGIKAIDKIDYANQKNIDFIICDHHLPGDAIPNAVAVLDPKQSDCEYPYKELCGAGVGFKLAQAYCLKNDLPKEEVFELLDLTSIAVAADIVPITGENRVIAYFGLELINTNPRPGIKAIFEHTKKENSPIVISDLVFTAAPRINAAGRMDTGRKAVDLLTSLTKEKAEEIASRIELNNSDRKDEDKSITKEALEIMDNDAWYSNAKSTVLFQPHWHKGVIGIVASRVIETHYKPTIILTQSGDKVAGSARSVKGFSVYNAIDACSDVITQFGGHKYAAGLTLPLENVELFRQKFEEVVSSTITEDQLTPEISIDCDIQFDEFFDDVKNGLPKLYRLLNQFEPFGPENMTPIFCLKGVIDNGWGKIVGDNHLKLNITHPNDTSRNINSIGFNLGHHLETILNKQPFDILFSLDKNEWQGNVSVQLKIRDIRQ